MKKALVEGGRSSLFETFLFLWVFLIILSIVFEVFRKAKRRKDPFEPIEVKTILTCPNCDFKEIRAFKVGDYIFKEEPCTCGSKRIISAIFRETKDDENEGSLNR
jgi:hypothetical protein